MIALILVNFFIVLSFLWLVGCFDSYESFPCPCDKIKDTLLPLLYILNFFASVGDIVPLFWLFVQAGFVPACTDSLHIHYVYFPVGTFFIPLYIFNLSKCFKKVKYFF